MAVAGCQLLLMGLGGIERKFGGGGGGVRIDFLKSLTTLHIRHGFTGFVLRIHLMQEAHSHQYTEAKHLLYAPT